MKIEIAAKQLEALGNVTRLHIFKTLIPAGKVGVSVGDIQKKLAIPASTLSHHITKLIQTNLIRQDRESRTLYCKANFQTMEQLLSFLLENCCQNGSCN